MKIYFTSDTHAYHKNICEGSTDWENKDHCRNFNDEFEMTEKMIENINNTVGYNDILYHLGDFSFGGKENIWKFRNRLIVKTVHFVLGNHDHHIEHNDIIPRDKGFINTRNLFTTVSYYLDKKINGQNMFLCHYPMRAWHKSNRGCWNLFGHCHNNLPPYVNSEGKHYKSIDVGIDTHSEFRPYSFDEIETIFNKQHYINFHEDHHK